MGSIEVLLSYGVKFHALSISFFLLVIFIWAWLSEHKRLKECLAEATRQGKGQIYYTRAYFSYKNVFKDAAKGVVALLFVYPIVLLMFS